MLGRNSNLGEFNYDFKVMLLGDSCTGKTCLLVRFKDNTFLNNNFISTVGIDYRNKIMLVDDIKVKLQLWDTAGQERFRSVTHSYYRDAHALMVVFDVASRNTFLNVRKWLQEIREYAKDDVLIFLIGNKSDLAEQRQISFNEAQSLADEFSLSYVETSAKTGKNVDTVFNAIAGELVARKVNSQHNGVRLSIADISSVNSSSKYCRAC